MYKQPNRTMIKAFRLLVTAALLAGMVIGLTPPRPAQAREVPTAKHIVDGSFTRASDVYAADLDGDGDLDILGAGSHLTSIIIWAREAVVVH